MNAADILSVLEATLRLATPLVFAALGGLFSERAGVAAMATGAALALIHGWVSIRQRGEQIVSGMALNFLMSGLCPTLALGWFGIGGGTPSLEPGARFMPVFGGISLIVLVAAALVPAAAALLKYSFFGLRLRAVGENPEAVDAAGLSVARLRYAALALCGVLAATGGAYIAIADGAGFTRDMTAGRGYVALAALIFGRWRVVPTAMACLLFAFADALQLRLQGVALPLIGAVPVQIVQALPYIVTLLVLAGLGGTSRMPAALGRPFRRAR